MKLTKYVDLLYDDQHLHPINKDHCSCRLPSNREIKKIISLTKELIFPGYFGKYITKETGSKGHTKRQIQVLYKTLSKQIAYGLLYITDGKGVAENKKQADIYTKQYLESIPKLRALLKTDLEAHFTGDPAAYNHDQIIVSYPGFYAIGIYRMAHVLYEMNIPLLPRMMTEFAHRETGIDINPGATIGEYFMIDHGTGVVIGETAKIGHHVKVYQGVTLGALTTKGGQTLKNIQRHPTIGDYVTIYAGASILGGNTTIGNHVTIGSNAFITESIADNKRVTEKSTETKNQLMYHI